MIREDVNSKLAILIQQNPDAEIVVLVDNNEIADPIMFRFTKHRIKDVEYSPIIELEDGTIYTSMENYLMDVGNGVVSEKLKYVLYTAIVITTEAGI